MSSLLQYLTLGSLVTGGLLALEIAGFGLVIAWPLALVLALVRRSRILPLRYLVAVFIWVMRGTPILLQLIFLYNVLPSTGIQLDAFWTAVIGLGINESAFSAEIIRGGLMAVGTSQTDAASSLGYSPAMTLFRVQVPQALRIIVPTLANEAIAMVKNTSLASVISVSELTLRSEQIVSVNFKYLPVFAAAAIIYLLATSLLVLVQRYLEAFFDLDKRAAGAGRRLTSALGRRRRAGSGQAVAGQAVAAVHNGNLDGSFGWLDQHHPDGLFNRYRQEVRRASGRQGTDLRAEVVLDISGLEKRFGHMTVLNHFNLSVRRGEVLCILGPSGSGKSTLLRIVDGLETASKGVVRASGLSWDHGRGGTSVFGNSTSLFAKGTSLRGRARSRDRVRAGLALVFQQFNLFQHRTVLQNVMDGPTKVLGIDPGLCQEVALMLLREVGLEPRAGAYPHHLSGGQQQRVAIARALALAPEIILFDEPTSALDPELVGEVLRIMGQLAAHGMTMVVVTHEIEFARRCATRVMYMEGGVVVEEGAPDQLLDRPRQAGTQRFLATITRAALPPTAALAATTTGATT